MWTVSGSGGAPDAATAASGVGSGTPPGAIDCESMDAGELPAGDFSTWFDEFRAALQGDNDADVPCDGCTACCASSQFVHIAPEETDTLAHIPSELLFAAPGMPAGHVVMGYDEHGRCPMLADHGCSIYDHRPRTCRTYDCRVFAATGVEIDDDKVLLAQRIRRWRFDHPTVADRLLHDAVRSAARAILTDGAEAPRPAEIAVRAVEVVVRHAVARPERA
jgi:Fe-S-cluster containining protein